MDERVHRNWRELCYAAGKFRRRWARNYSGELRDLFCERSLQH
jgi:hypothetical protein